MTTAPRRSRGTGRIRMMSDAPTPNPTPEGFLKNCRRVADAKRDGQACRRTEVARGVYRSALKAAKKIGVNQAMLIRRCRS